MNILSKLAQKGNTIVNTKTVLGEENYQFKWNEPANENDILKFEERIGYKLPDAYREFLLIANGGIIFESEYEEDGYRILGIHEIFEFTREMKEYGYKLSESWYCFLQCLFSNDVLFFDLSKEKNYIIDGDMAYPIHEWECLKETVNEFFIHLCQANGTMFWRW